MKIEVVLKDVGAGGNGAKARIVREYSPTRSKTKLRKMHL